MTTQNHITASQARRTLFGLIEQVAADDELAVPISSKNGNAVLIGERHWRQIQETLFLFTDPYNSIELQKSILEIVEGNRGKRVDLDELAKMIPNE
jgi:prevent-host-death family protein